MEVVGTALTAETFRRAGEQRQRHGVAHKAITFGRRVQTVAGIERLAEPLRLRRIPHQGVEIDDRIQIPRCPNPVVDSVAIGFAWCIRMVIAGSSVRHDCRADDLDPVLVCSPGHLRISSDHPLDEGVMGRSRNGCIARKHPEIVYAFEDDDISNGAALEHVTAEAGNGTGCDAGFHEAVAADADVEHRDRALRSLEPLGEKVRPARVGVGHDSMPIDDRIADDCNGCRQTLGFHIDRSQIVPAVDGGRST